MRDRRLLIATLAAAVAAGGCNAILGLGDVRSAPDAPPGAPDAAVDAAPLVCPHSSNGNVVACWFDLYISPTGATTLVPRDLSTLNLVALVPDASSSGFRTVSAQVIGPGVATFDGIAAGTSFYVHSLGFGYRLTDQRDLDLSGVFVGRPGAKPVTSQTEMTLQLSAMTAWQSPDYLLADSFAVDTENFIGAAAVANPPKVGDTSTGLTVDWQSGYGFGNPPMLIDGAQHDDLWVVHVTSATVDDGARHAYVAQRVADSFTSTAVTEANGSPVTVTGAFAQVGTASTETFTIDLPGLRSAVSSGNRFAWDEASCALLTNPAADYGDGIGPGLVGIDGSPALVFAPQSQGQVTFAPIAYGNPYPAAWPVIVACSLAQYRFVAGPGANAIAAPLTHRITDWDSFAGSSYTASAGGHAPTGITIGGKPLLDGGAVAFDGVSPVTMQWNAVPGTDYYKVQIKEVVVDVGQTSLGAGAALYTTGTTLTIPAALLQQDHLYVFIVSEVRQRPNYATGHLVRTATPSTGGQVASGIFRMSSACGNSQLDGTEQCDTGGDSAKCDADCSRAVCGDGYVNAAAGEQCDDVYDSPRCVGGTCKLSACGDGYTNPNAAEQCDDGNAVDGDGCNHLCQLEHCGDGMHQPYEGCDDGNLLNGDGCSAFCTVEGGFTCDNTMTPSKCTRM